MIAENRSDNTFIYCSLQIADNQSRFLTSVCVNALIILKLTSKYQNYVSQLNF